MNGSGDSWIDAVSSLQPFLSGAPEEGVLAALEKTRDAFGVDVIGVVLCRNGKPVTGLWLGPEDERRSALLECVDVGEPPRVDVIARGAILSAKLCVEGGAELEGESRESVRQLMTLVASRWIAARELADVRSEKAQQESWFKTMDEQIRVLDRERQKFVAVVNQTDTFMFVVTPDLVVSWVNHALARHWETIGVSGGPGAGLTDAWSILGIDAPEPGSAECPVRRALAEKAVSHEELQRAQDGEIHDLYLTFLPIQGPDGAAAEVLVMIQDLSGLEVLRRLEARYRRLFERSPDGMVMVDPEGERILLANQAMARMTGLDREELLRRPLTALHPDTEWEVVRSALAEAVSSDRGATAEWHVKRQEGKPVIASVTATRFESDGRVVALVQYRDVTEKRMLEMELHHSQKMEAVGCLAGGVAHDFNNLLTVILGQSELLAKRVEADSGLHGVTQTIRRSALRGSLLTRRLLAFSRKEVVKAEVLDFTEVVRNIATLLDNLLGEQVRLATELDGPPCFIRADVGRMEQVVMNLALNARDAMPDGGVLSLRVRPDGRDAMLEVSDTGVGMDAATQSRIFEPFFTTKKAGEGTGLGLSTVYGIVEQASGIIDLQSEPGEGTTVRIRFPLASTTTRAPQRPPPDPVASAGGGDLTSGCERILLVEDEGDLREMASEALELAGYEVVAAEDGESALELCRGGADFQLLLTDVVMPGMSGGELAQRIRSTRREARVLYMSGYNDDAIVRQGVSVDEASFIQKPFTLDALTRKVRQLLDSPPPVAAG